MIHIYFDDLSENVYDEGDNLYEEVEGLEQTSGGGYLLRLNSIPSVLFKYIIGREGKTKASIEKDTRCRVRIPAKGKEGEIGTCVHGTNIWCSSLTFM